MPLGGLAALGGAAPGSRLSALRRLFGTIGGRGGAGAPSSTDAVRLLDGLPSRGGSGHDEICIAL